MNHKILIISVIMLLAPLSLLMEGVSAEDYSVDIVDANGQAISEDTPLVDKLIIFKTKTDVNGVKYVLPADTDLSTEATYYLRIVSTSPKLYYANAVATNVPETLQVTGIKITLSNPNHGTETYTAELTDDEFTDDFELNGSKAVLSLNKDYLIRIHTLGNYSENAGVPSGSNNMTLRFNVFEAEGCAIHFMDGTEEIESRVVESGQAIGDLPMPPERESYVFDGWYDISGNRFTADSIVNTDITLHTKWTRIQPDPDPDPPDVWPKETETIETIVNPDNSVTVIDTVTIEYKDGSDDV